MPFLPTAIDGFALPDIRIDMLKDFLIALALATDAFIVALIFGTHNQKMRFALKVSLLFGLFQGFMTFFGWFGGLTLHRYICQVDHWLAFALLTGIGIKMLFDKPETQNAVAVSCAVLCIAALSTSVDALAVGFSFAMLEKAILTPSVIIGAVTLVLCMLANPLSRFADKIPHRILMVTSAVILIAIGLRILYEHIFVFGEVPFAS